MKVLVGIEMGARKKYTALGAQVKDHGSVPAGKLWKSLENESSIPAGNFSCFIRCIQINFLSLPAETGSKSSRKNLENFWLEYYFHLPTLFQFSGGYWTYPATFLPIPRVFILWNQWLVGQLRVLDTLASRVIFLARVSTNTAVSLGAE